MVTAPTQDRKPSGRAASSIRTPQLIRDFLSGQGEFPEDTLEERAARPTQGDYIARMHRRIKLFIRSQVPAYQFPRRHSFGALGTERGFKQRVYIRLTPGSLERREWADPMGFISLIYPNIRPPERPLPEVTPPRAPRPPRVSPPAPPPEIEQLERRRQAIVSEAAALAATGDTVAEFQGLLERATQLVNEATRALPPRPWPDAFEALILLENCIRLLEQETEPPALRMAAVINCQSSSRLLAEALRRPLVAAPVAPPVTVPELPDFELPDSPTREGVAALARHLRLLQQLGVERGDVQGRVAELEQDLADWELQLEESIGREEARDEPRQDLLEACRRIQRAVEEARGYLEVRLVARAIEALERAYPPVVGVTRAPEAEPEPAEGYPPVPGISLPTRFSTRSVPRLVQHLQALAELAEDQDWPGDEEPESAWPEMAAEVNRLVEAGTDWRDAAQESLDNEEARDTPREDRVTALEERVRALEEYVSALEEQDLTAAIESLEGLQ